MKLMVFTHENTTKSGVKFTSYTFKGNSGKWNKIKFSKSVTDRPTKKGYYEFDIPDNHIWKDKDSDFPTYWCNEVTSYTKSEQVNKDEELPF